MDAWRSGKDWLPFKAVFLLPLRNLVEYYRSNSAIADNSNRLKPNELKLSLAELLLEHCLGQPDTITPEMLMKYCGCFCDQILWILDGYDEIASHLSSGTRFQQLFQYLVRRPKVLVVSRPHEMVGLKSYHFDRFLENLGFTNENIETYIVQRFGSEKEEDGYDHKEDHWTSERFLQFLRKDPNLWEIVHIPLNLTLICEVWGKPSYCEGEGGLTLTQLYNNLVTHLHDRYLIKQKEADLGKLETDKTKLYTPLDVCLELLAFDLMKNGQLLSTPRSFRSNKPSQIVEIITKVKKYYPDEKQFLKDVTCSGFLNSSGIEKFDKNKSYAFLHLTFQEFFTAQYLTKSLLCSYDEDIEPLYFDRKLAFSFIDIHKDHRRYDIVWWFMAGLLKDSKPILQKFFDTLLCMMEINNDKVSVKYPVLVEFSYLGLRCLEEAHTGGNLPMIDQEDNF